jgi:hypothetical protein
VIVAPGKRKIELKREGYEPTSTIVNVLSGQKLQPKIDLKAKAPGAKNKGGTVDLQIEPADATVEINGKVETARSVALPVGRHRVSIEKAGFMTIHRDIEVDHNDTNRLKIELPPSAERREEMVYDAEGSRSIVWALGAVGVVLTLAGIGVTAWSVSQLVTHNETIDGVQKGPDCQSPDDQAQINCAAALEREEGERDPFVGFVAGGAVGLALGITAFSFSVYLFTEGRDPDEIRIELPPELASIRVGPRAAIGENGAVFGLSGSF